MILTLRLMGEEKLIQCVRNPDAQQELSASNGQQGVDVTGFVG